MIKLWFNRLIEKINQSLRVFYTKRLVKLYKEKVFIQNEKSYKEHIFEIEKEKLLTKLETQKLSQDQELVEIKKFEDQKAEDILKIDQQIAHKIKKIDDKIAAYKLKHDALSKRMDRHLEEDYKVLDQKIDLEKEKLQSLKDEKASLLEADSKDDKRLKALDELIESKEEKIYQHHKSVDILATRKRIENDQNIHLSLSHLTMKFGGLKAVDDLSFDVKKGEIFGLIGPNGAGKTTVFNCITQFYKPNEGNIFYNNQNNETNSLIDFKVHDIINLGIVRTFQNVELVWELTVLDNLLVGAHSLYHAGFFSQLLHLPKLNYEEKVIKNRALEILKDLNLLAYKDMYPYGLPYGILKKIELARTLMTKPNLIILDEPAAGLNDSETQELAETIRNIRDRYKLTIFLVEHDMGLVMDICDTICAISFGKKLAIGSPKEIQNNPKVQEAYLGGE
ncbi:MAG: ATP-binding cassette domain-containing protein [Candidatus Izemoplasmatales bacterium]